MNQSLSKYARMMSSCWIYYNMFYVGIWIWHDTKYLYVIYNIGIYIFTTNFNASIILVLNMHFQVSTNSSYYHNIQTICSEYFPVKIGRLFYIFKIKIIFILLCILLYSVFYQYDYITRIIRYIHCIILLYNIRLHAAVVLVFHVLDVDLGL